MREGGKGEQEKGKRKWKKTRNERKEEERKTTAINNDSTPVGEERGAEARREKKKNDLPKCYVAGILLVSLNTSSHFTFATLQPQIILVLLPPFLPERLPLDTF